jgi:hypothetical protein
MPKKPLNILKNILELLMQKLKLNITIWMLLFSIMF